jgi:hypothetical protein
MAFLASDENFHFIAAAAAKRTMEEVFCHECS